MYSSSYGTAPRPNTRQPTTPGHNLPQAATYLPQATNYPGATSPEPSAMHSLHLRTLHTPNSNAKPTAPHVHACPGYGPHVRGWLQAAMGKERNRNQRCGTQVKSKSQGGYFTSCLIFDTCTFGTDKGIRKNKTYSTGIGEPTRDKCKSPLHVATFPFAPLCLALFCLTIHKRFQHSGCKQMVKIAGFKPPKILAPECLCFGSRLRYIW
ncbi:hypothetical protein EV426DRAFT_643299 [Tirmania nivea]|nr:hypothetical protein EV426DRAFT_643299 [Tirmania nivea]